MYAARWYCFMEKKKKHFLFFNSTPWRVCIINRSVVYTRNSIPAINRRTVRSVYGRIITKTGIYVYTTYTAAIGQLIRITTIGSRPPVLIYLSPPPTTTARLQHDDHYPHRVGRCGAEKKKYYFLLLYTDGIFMYY